MVPLPTPLYPTILSCDASILILNYLLHNRNTTLITVGLSLLLVHQKPLPLRVARCFMSFVGCGPVNGIADDVDGNFRNPHSSILNQCRSTWSLAHHATTMARRRGRNRFIKRTTACHKMSPVTDKQAEFCDPASLARYVTR